MDSVSFALFGKVRSSVLALLFCHSETSFYFRQIERALGMGRGAVQRELRNLFDAGLISRRKQGNQVYYQANPQSVIFSELKSLMMKTAGIVGILRKAMRTFQERVRTAFIYGSFARGTEKADSDVDVLVIGDISFSEIGDALAALEQSVGREINPSVYPIDEFVEKLSRGHHFLNSLVEAPKIFLVGDEDEFKRLVEEWMVG